MKEEQACLHFSMSNTTRSCAKVYTAISVTTLVLSEYCVGSTEYMESADDSVKHFQLAQRHTG